MKKEIVLSTIANQKGKRKMAKKKPEFVKYEPAVRANQAISPDRMAIGQIVERKGLADTTRQAIRTKLNKCIKETGWEFSTFYDEEENIYYIRRDK